MRPDIRNIRNIEWPAGRSFAFTVFDDTDRATLDNVPHVYGFLGDLGLRTTKSVWPVEGVREPSVVGGTTCGDKAYLELVLRLKGEGFEIGFHNATYHSSTREETLAGLDVFERLFGHPPRSMANHTECREGIYWGTDRLTGANRLVYDLVTLGKKRGLFRGHVPGDRYFWGDLCRERITYVRNFTFPEPNTLKACPFMPYHDPERPFVNLWFAASDGDRIDRYNRLLGEKNQDRLEREGGACIVYTHFGKGFARSGALDSRFKQLMRRLASKNGWFVPVSTLLDHIVAVRGRHTVSSGERARLERRWLFHKVLAGLGRSRRLSPAGSLPACWRG
jgi:hypothetical protein